MQRWIYLDNGATTRVDPRVAEVALRTMTEQFGNPSSRHRLGVEAARLLADARERVARALCAEPGEITFTSGGTEANTLGFYGAARASRQRHVVLSAFEHPSIADAAKRLGEEGYDVSAVAPTPAGVVEPARFAELVRPDTAAVALLWVQNELGTVQPVFEVAELVKARAPRCHVHLDAVQAVGKLPVDVKALPIDSLALSAHKIHGPKGVGALWLRQGARIAPSMWGGGQERGLRPGTEGLPNIVALGVAIELAEADRAEAAARMTQLRERLWEGILSQVPTARRNGLPAQTAPHILSVGFSRLPAEPLLHALEHHDVCVSAGSACHARDRRPSATLRAIGVPEDTGTLRFSLSRFTTDEEIALAITAVGAAVKELS